MLSFLNQRDDHGSGVAELSAFELSHVTGGDGHVPPPNDGNNYTLIKHVQSDVDHCDTYKKD